MRFWRLTSPTVGSQQIISSQQVGDPGELIVEAPAPKPAGFIPKKS